MPSMINNDKDTLIEVAKLVHIKVNDELLEIIKTKIYYFNIFKQVNLSNIKPYEYYPIVLKSDVLFNDTVEQKNNNEIKSNKEKKKGDFFVL